MIDELQEAVVSFINEKNHLYLQTQEYKGKKVQEYSKKIAELTKKAAQPDTQDLDNVKKLLQLVTKDLSELNKDLDASKNFRQQAEGFHVDNLPSVILTRAFNNSYDITYGFVSTNVTSKQWHDLFSSVSSTQKPGALLEMAKKDNNRKDMAIASRCLNSKDAMRTLSNCMERDDWSTCQMKFPYHCCMPNIKRTPDIAVCVIGQEHEEKLNYPIFIGEVLGKKDPGSKNEQLYEGYNAALQSLVFAHRGYYWEIPETEAKMYMLQKDPETASIIVTDKRYNLLEGASVKDKPNGMTPMIRDLCHVFFDGLLHLRLVAEHSAKELYKANYREFLSTGLDTGRAQNIQTHCWHVFTPRAATWNDENPPPPFHEDDAEDPEKPKKAKKQYPTRVSFDVDGDVIPITNQTYDYSQVQEASLARLPPQRSRRSDVGDPLKHDVPKFGSRV